MGPVTVSGDLEETFEAIVFDWDGTAVPDRQADASPFRSRVEALCAAGVHLFVVSGTHVGNLDLQLGARPAGPGKLYLCANRGSEVFEVGTGGPSLVYWRTASEEEDRYLDLAAETAVKILRGRGLETEIVSSRLNRRKIDLIPVPAWADPKKADIALLAAAVSSRLVQAGISGLSEVVALSAEAATAAGLRSPRITSDVKHVEIGLTDKSDSARFASAWLAGRGITGRLVLIGGDEFGAIGGTAGSDSLMLIDDLAGAAVVSVGVEPEGVPERVLHLAGGPGRFAAILDGQLARRADRRVPQIDDDPRWVIPLPAHPAKERVAEALGALSNGWAGTRACREEDGPGSSPLFAVAGTYDGNGRLMPGPIWTGLDLGGGPRHRDHRLLDLRTGVLARRDLEDSGLRSLRFVSGDSPDTLAFRAEARDGELEPGDPLRAPTGGAFEHSEREGVHLARTTGGEGDIRVAARDRVRVSGGRKMVERLATWTSGEVLDRKNDDVRDRLTKLESAGFDALLAAQRTAWAALWADAEVRIEGGDQAAVDELACRFSVFHLLSAAADAGEAAVGARGLSGEAYSGHVFWDSDVFVLPALAAIRPRAARAMLEYRIRRLPAAAAAASAKGLSGARFPWESAGEGTDVTPKVVMNSTGDMVPIATGAHEEHIVADVAWAANHYAAWTGDATFLSDGAGRPLLVETARYWADRVRVDNHGNGHIYGVMGPDEYHEVVDDNAYTNVMARWNLRHGAKLLAGSGQGDDVAEASRWNDLADRLVDGWTPERGIYEQFAGYFDLEPLLVSQVARPPVAIDVVLGPERVSGSQLIKQADALMLYHLVPQETAAGSLEACLGYYEPRTAHGSSLSPAISASLLARARRPDEALELFRLAARLDLDDLTGTTAGGLHLATMGGVWQALAFGFLGLAADGGVLQVDPQLPREWSALALRMRFQGQSIGVRSTHDQVTVSCSLPLTVRVGQGLPACCDPPGSTFSSVVPLSTDRSHA